MDNLQLISGPIGAAIVEFNGRTYYIFSDSHNDTSGSCSDCNDPSGKCLTFTSYIDKMLRGEEMVDFFIESPYVLIDLPSKPVADLGKFDIIERLQNVLWYSMMRCKDKSPYMPKNYVHYADIRDVYIDCRVKDNNIRSSKSANPLSGSWSVKRLGKCVTEGDVNEIVRAVDEVTEHMKWILDNSRCLFKSFVTSDFNPPRCKGDSDRELDFNERVDRMKAMTSLYGDKRVHRVCKQLLKLDEATRNSLLEWAWDKFDTELEKAYKLFEEWKRQIGWYVATLDRSMYNPISEVPVWITIVIGAIVMDLYLLARSFYHNESKCVVIYAGAAHVVNYLDYLTKNGGKVVDKYEPMCGSERCLVVR